MLATALLVAVALAEPVAVTLDEAVSRAVTEAAGVRAAGAAEQAAEARLAQAKASRLPTLGVSGNVNVWNDEQVVQFIPEDSGLDCSVMDPSFQSLCYGLSSPLTVRDQVTAGLTVRIVEPVTFHVAHDRVVAARAGVEASAAARDAAVLDARWAAADAWFSALQAERQLEIAEAQVKSLEARVRTAQVAYDKGSLVRNDLLLAQLALANAQQAVLQVTSLRNAAYARLGMAIGNGGEPVRPAAASEEAPRVPPAIDALITKALASRPDLAALRAQIDAAAGNAAVASWSRLPQVNAVAAYTHSEGMGVFAEKDAAFVGASLDWTVWAWGQKTQALHAAEAGQAQLAAQLEGAEAGVRVEVRTRAEALLAAAAAYDVAGRSIEQAEENLRLQEQRNALGSATMTELLDAEAAKVRAQNNRASALYDARRAEAALERAMGVDPWSP